MADSIDILLVTVALFIVLATAIPLMRHDYWWIRIFDFPRAQIAIGGIAMLAACYWAWDIGEDEYLILLVLLAASVLYQIARMFPYSPLAPKQVRRAGEHPSEGAFSLLIANVLMTNQQSGRFLDLVRRYNPDLILTAETDAWWEQQLNVLEEAYPSTVKYPLDNTYGILLYTRLRLIGPEVKFLVEDDIPSIHACLELANGCRVQLRCIHPKPPYPREAKQTTERDAELLIVGKEVHDLTDPVVVAGDLNDVAWSHTTHLFQKISGLLDPRRGRGLYSTFHAHNSLMRWPLDHVFHSNHFTLVHLERLPDFGSDHFPVFIKLNLEMNAEEEQEEPEANGDEKQEAAEKIEKARERQP